MAFNQTNRTSSPFETQKTAENTNLNVHLDSAAGPTKSTKIPVFYNTTMIKKGSVCTKSTSWENSSKRKSRIPTLQTIDLTKNKSNGFLKPLVKSSNNCCSRAKMSGASIAMVNANSVNKSKKYITSEKSMSSASNSNTINVQQKENIANCASSSGIVMNKSRKKCAANAVLKEKNDKNNLVKCSDESLVEFGLFDGLETKDYDNQFIYDIMQSPGKITPLLHTEMSESETPPFFFQRLSSTTMTNSLIISEPPTPLSKSEEAKVLKCRVKAPKLTLNEEINSRLYYNEPLFDYDATFKMIDKMFELVNVLDKYCSD